LQLKLIDRKHKVVYHNTMLENTFQHIKGIGPDTERKLWDCGITSWNRVLNNDECMNNLQGSFKHRLIREISISHENLLNKNIHHFIENLPAKSIWRVFPNFRDKAVYFDIETTGLYDYDSYITTISLYDGEEIKYYINGINLEKFAEDIFNYDLLITYNGKGFDVPWVEKFFKIKLPHAHIDLRFLLSSLGYKGGLKKIEKAFGIDRGDLDGIDGFFGIKLWFDYLENKNEKALETLLAYNIEDVVNLELLMILAYNKCLCETPFMGANKLPVIERPKIPYQPDMETVQQLLMSGGTWY